MTIIQNKYVILKKKDLTFLDEFGKCTGFIEEAMMLNNLEDVKYEIDKLDNTNEFEVKNLTITYNCV